MSLFTSSRSCRIKTWDLQVLQGKINEQWLITAPVPCDGGLGGAENCNFFPLVSIFNHQSCRKKQKILTYLVCLQRQAAINNCWREKWGEARKEKRRGCVAVGGSEAKKCRWFQSCVWVWGRSWSQALPRNVWDHFEDTLGRHPDHFELVSCWISWDVHTREAALLTP